MTATVTSRESKRMPLGQDHRRRRAVLPARRYGLGVATCLVLATSPMAGCDGGTSTETVDNLNAHTITVGQHLYIKAPDGTKFEISVGKDASGKDVVTATRVDK
jgi:hypothetical protein